MIFGHYPLEKVRWFINTFSSFQKPLWILKEWKKFMSKNLSFYKQTADCGEPNLLRWAAL